MKEIFRECNKLDDMTKLEKMNFFENVKELRKNVNEMNTILREYKEFML